MKEYAFGIDLGGTGIKIGVVDESGAILSQGETPTLAGRPYEDIIADMGRCMLDVMARGGFEEKDVASIGVGIPGVADARQYTIPVPAALDAVRAGGNPQLTTRQKHTRECFVVAEEGADTAAIEEAIVTMPNYFADYDTTVTFISQEELDRDHAGIPHGGSVIRTGTTGAAGENTHVIEYSLKLDSNPEFTGSVLVACARACWRMACAGETGCRTIFDIAPALLSPMTPEELRAKML